MDIADKPQSYYWFLNGRLDSNTRSLRGRRGETNHGLKYSTAPNVRFPLAEWGWRPGSEQDGILRAGEVEGRVVDSSYGRVSRYTNYELLLTRKIPPRIQNLRPHLFLLNMHALCARYKMPSQMSHITNSITLLILAVIFKSTIHCSRHTHTFDIIQ